MSDNNFFDPNPDDSFDATARSIVDNTTKEAVEFAGSRQEEPVVRYRNFFGFNPDGSLNVMPGSNINNAVNEAIGLAISRQEPLKFEFNEVTVTVEANSNPELILRDWRRALNGYIENNVGPHPKVELSAEELANDARIEAENQARHDAESARYRAEAKAHRDRVETRMTNAPAMEFINEEGRALWQSWVDANTDFLGAGIIHYAERWARMMQLEMSEGKTLEEVYEATRNEADLEGMSGASGGMAEQALVQVWMHGAELARARDEYLRTIRSRFSDSQS